MGRAVKKVKETAAMVVSERTAGELAETHPVLSILWAQVQGKARTLPRSLSQRDAALTRAGEGGGAGVPAAPVFDPELMQVFLDYELRVSVHGVPYTLTAFLADYVNLAIVRFMAAHRNQYGGGNLRWDLPGAKDALARLAFVQKVRDVKLTEAMVTQTLPKTVVQSMDSPAGGRRIAGVNSATGVKVAGADPKDNLNIQLRSFGLLKKVDPAAAVTNNNNRKGTVYQFRESCVRDYLVALFLSQECQRKVTASRQGRHVVSSAMRESMQKLPSTGDIWRVAFGLLSREPPTREVQQDVLKELIGEAKLLSSLTRFDITNMCVESIYESQNGGELAQMLDEFTLNQSVRYSNQFLEPSRLLYAISAVGYLVRSSGHVYGVHMSQFGLGTNIRMLADPLNDISDNNLQVLNLSYNPLGSAGMKGLLRFLVKATLLTHLDLTACEIGNLGVTLLAEFFMCMPLRYLRLTENDIGDSGVLRLAANLKYVTTLEWIDLSDNEISDKSAVPLGESIRVLHNLRSLDLRSNHIGDEGAHAITRSLADLRSVTQLMLAGNRIGERGANHISDHVWKSKSLRFINLSLNEIPAAGILGLRRAASSHGSLKISVSERDNPDGSTNVLDISGISEADFIVTPIEEEEERPEPPSRPLSMILLPSAPDEYSSNVDLLAGRANDFERGTPGRRSWAARSNSLRRSFHSLGGSFRRKGHVA